MQDEGEGPLPALLSQHDGDVVVGIAGVDHQRQPAASGGMRCGCETPVPAPREVTCRRNSRAPPRRSRRIWGALPAARGRPPSRPALRRRCADACRPSTTPRHVPRRWRAPRRNGERASRSSPSASPRLRPRGRSPRRALRRNPGNRDGSGCRRAWVSSNQWRRGGATPGHWRPGRSRRSRRHPRARESRPRTNRAPPGGPGGSRRWQRGSATGRPRRR